MAGCCVDIGGKNIAVKTPTRLSWMETFSPNRLDSWSDIGYNHGAWVSWMDDVGATVTLDAPIISAARLRDIILDVVVVDARASKNARQDYQDAHIHGALFVDLDFDLADKSRDASYGGRHPLPSPSNFVHVLTSLGIAPETPVVVYDDQSGALAAARFWWMLRSFGHRNVAVLDGGLQAAAKAGIAIDSDIFLPRNVDTYPAREWYWPTVSIDDVDRVRDDPAWHVIDVRSAERYRGDVEPLDPVAGHIPGAINIPYTENLNLDGTFKSAHDLREYYAKLLANNIKRSGVEKVIIHCGSGVTACHTLLALEHAGLSGGALYVGSWSEWCRSGRSRAST